MVDPIAVPSSPPTSPDTLQCIGNATMLLRFGGLTVLTDPNFLHAGQRAYLGYGLSTPRLHDPALAIDELPDVDAVLLSHLHGDHFDRVARRRLTRRAPVLTTRHAARRLARWGFESAGLDPWEQVEVERGSVRMTVTSVPGRHGPGPLNRLLPPVMGSLVDLVDGTDGRRLRIYITGDSLLGPHVAEVAERFPEIDLLVLHLGGTRLLGLTLTMTGEDGAALIEALLPAQAVPVHMDDYRIFRSPPSAFVEAARQVGMLDRVTMVPRGGTIDLAPGPWAALRRLPQHSALG
ncbi:MAG TPA: MBL fold metallo-hydrolase [Candidatus Nanopelagicales bacterium]